MKKNFSKILENANFISEIKTSQSLIDLKFCNVLEKDVNQLKNFIETTINFTSLEHLLSVFNNKSHHPLSKYNFIILANGDGRLILIIYSQE